MYFRVLLEFFNYPFMSSEYVILGIHIQHFL